MASQKFRIVAGTRARVVAGFQYCSSGFSLLLTGRCAQGRDPQQETMGGNPSLGLGVGHAVGKCAESLDRDRTRIGCGKDGPRRARPMRQDVRILGVAMMVVGAVWVLQGMRVLPGSFMTGSSFWAVTGAAAVVLGMVLRAWTRLR